MVEKIISTSINILLLVIQWVCISIFLWCLYYAEIFSSVAFLICSYSIFVCRNSILKYLTTLVIDEFTGNRWTRRKKTQIYKGVVRKKRGY